LSPRFVLVEKDAGFARRLAEALAGELSLLERSVPRGRLDDVEAGDEVWYRRCLAAHGELFAAGTGMVALREPSDPAGHDPPAGPSPSDLPPIGRHLEVVVVASLERALAELAGWLTAVAFANDSLAERCRHVVPLARVCACGGMQQPPLDGPVDRRAPPAGEVVLSATLG
jgi:hypothetical protein